MSYTHSQLAAPAVVGSLAHLHRTFGRRALQGLDIAHPHRKDLQGVLRLLPSSKDLRLFLVLASIVEDSLIVLPVISN